MLSRCGVSLVGLRFSGGASADRGLNKQVPTVLRCGQSEAVDPERLLCAIGLHEEVMASDVVRYVLLRKNDKLVQRGIKIRATSNQLKLRKAHKPFPVFKRCLWVKAETIKHTEQVVSSKQDHGFLAAVTIYKHWTVLVHNPRHHVGQCRLCLRQRLGREHGVHSGQW